MVQSGGGEGVRTGPSPAALSNLPRWTATRAADWYAAQPWILGVCYSPSYAVNELEMWQPETFDPDRLDTELGWAKDIGLNTVRVFLHDLLWAADPSGFLSRIDTFLAIADRHGLRVIFVFFDSCWDPEPRAGPQPEPRPGVSMSRWVQSPGTAALEDPSQYPRLEEYVRGVARRFATDERVLCWDVWNEPDHLPDHQTGPLFAEKESPQKLELVSRLLPQAFDWIRSSGARQPLTSGLWNGDWSSSGSLRPVERLQVELSDVLTFHSYEPPEGFARKILWLQSFGRPVMCTEFLARTEGSTLRGALGVARKHNVGALSWGFVAGRTQAYLPWNSWERAYPDGMPAVWFHDLLGTNGQPYDAQEIAYLREVAKFAAVRPSPRA